MPNWCDNTLTIRHADENKLKELLQAMQENKFCGFVLPEPDYSTTPVAKTYPEISAYHANSEEERELAIKNEPSIREDSWWDWRVQNWGTKWEVETDHVDYSDNEISCCFSSAWAPPLGIYAKLHELGFEVEAFFFEPGCDFAGKFIDGVENIIAVSDYDKDFWHNDSFGVQLDERFNISENYFVSEEE